jgi:hypothetical protein
MRGLDAEHVHQANRILGHVDQLVGRGDRDLQEPQLQEFERGEALAAGQMRGFSDVAVVEADHAEAARGELAAEFVVPVDHLGAEPHDQQQRFRGRIAENFVANVDAVGAGDLRRLMGEHGVSLGWYRATIWHGFPHCRRRCGG